MNAANFAQQHRRPHVVCVNDYPDLLEMVSAALDEEGYDSTPLQITPESADEIAALRPDALVVDLVTNNKRSWHLLERIQENPVTRNIPLLVISTDADGLETVQREPGRYGGNEFMLKPFDVFELCKAIRRLIRVSVNDE